MGGILRSAGRRIEGVVYVCVGEGEGRKSPGIWATLAWEESHDVTRDRVT